MRDKCLFAIFFIIISCIKRIYIYAESVLYVICRNSGKSKCFIADKFRRHVLSDLVTRFLYRRNFCQIIITRSNIRNRDSYALRIIKYTHEVIVSGFLKSLHIKVGSGSDYSCHISFYDSLSLLRVLSLFADSNFISF